MPYTIQKNGKLYFSKRAPAGLSPKSEIVLLDRKVTIGRNGYVRFSLGNLSKKEAKPVALRFAAELDALGLSAEKDRPALPAETLTFAPPCVPSLDGPVFHPTDEEVRNSAQALYAFLMAEDEKAYKRQVSGALGDKTPSATSIPNVDVPFRKVLAPRERAELLDIPPPTAEGDAQLIRELFPLFSLFLHLQNEKMLAQPDARLLPMVRVYRQYVADLRLRAAAGEVPTPPMPPPLKSGKKDKVSQEKSGWGWDDALNYYFEIREVKPKTAESYSASWGSLRESVKVPLEELAVEHVVKWRDALLKTVHATTSKNRLVQSEVGCKQWSRKLQAASC